MQRRFQTLPQGERTNDWLWVKTDLLSVKGVPPGNDYLYNGPPGYASLYNGLQYPTPCYVSLYNGLQYPTPGYVSLYNGLQYPHKIKILFNVSRNDYCMWLEFKGEVFINSNKHYAYSI